MEIFLSWSGEKSKRAASFLDEWLRLVLQTADPWMSTSIDRGAVWFSAIYEKIAVTKIGLICLTKENINKPWILFEAGALARGLQSQRVCPVLIDLPKSDVTPPLSQLNLTECNHEDIFRLVVTVNSLLTNPLDPKRLERIFEKYWGEFESEIAQIKELPSHTPEKVAESGRDRDSKIDELLDMVRGLQMNQVIATRSTSAHDSPDFRTPLALLRDSALKEAFELYNAKKQRSYIAMRLHKKFPPNVANDALLGLEQYHKRLLENARFDGDDQSSVTEIQD